MAKLPSVTAVRFLQRLAPHAGEAAAAVRAALPSRFAPGDASELVVESATPPAGDGAAAPRSEPVASPTPQVEQAATVVTVDSARVVQQSVAKHELAPSRLRPLAEREESAKAPARTKCAAAAPTLPERPSRAKADAGTQPRPQAARSIPQPAPNPAAISKSFAAMARPAVDIRPPLRESAVALRTAPARSEALAVVHVTIDRIDVHTPTPGPLTPRQPPKPRASSTVSLSDYLRQRDRARHGDKT